MKKINWKTLIISFVIVYLVAATGSIFTSQNVNTDWYQTIKPSITPPNWVFPVVWNFLFFLIAVSLFLSWISAKNKLSKIKIGIAFGTNFLLNIIWSFLYFGLKNPLYAFFDLILLWLSIAGMIYITRKVNKKAAWLLVPYFLWVSFAGILNYLSIL